MERLAVGEGERRANGHLGLAQLRQVAVLVENGLPAPTPRPVELHDHVLSSLEAQVVDPVLEAGQRRAVAGRLEAAGLHRLQHPVRRQCEEEVRHGCGV